jgi:hypothetical protein
MPRLSLVPLSRRQPPPADSSCNNTASASTTVNNVSLNITAEATSVWKRTPSVQIGSTNIHHGSITARDSGKKHDCTTQVHTPHARGNATPTVQKQQWPNTEIVAATTNSDCEHSTSTCGGGGVFEELPQELVEHVLQFADTWTKGAAAQVCRLWSAAALSPAVWKASYSRLISH